MYIFMNHLDLAKQILTTSLQLEDVDLQADTQILGDFPQFNSLSIAGMVASIEEELGCEIDDEEITAELFETVGSLAAFIESKSQ